MYLTLTYIYIYLYLYIYIWTYYTYRLEESPVNCSKSQVLHELGFGPTDILIAIIMSVAWLHPYRDTSQMRRLHVLAVDSAQGTDLAVFLLLHLLCRLARDDLQQTLIVPWNKRPNYYGFRSVKTSDPEKERSLKSELVCGLEHVLFSIYPLVN